jgi:hypothetical protein
MTVPDDVNWLSRIDAEQLRTKEDLPAREELLRTSQGAAGLGSWEYDFAADSMIWSEQTRRLLGSHPPSRRPSMLYFRAPTERIAAYSASDPGRPAAEEDMILATIAAASASRITRAYASARVGTYRGLGHHFPDPR